MKIKRVLSSLLAISILFSFSLTASAVDKTTEIKHTIDITHVSPEDRDSFVENSVRAYIEKNQPVQVLRDDRYYTYHTEDSYKTGYVTGYADHQYPNGYVLDGDGTDGLFWWDAPESTEYSASVTFSVPYKLVTITATLGAATLPASSTTGVFKTASAGPGNYKMKVTKTVEVRRVLIYQTDTRTGKTVLWDDMYFQTILDAKPELVKL